MGADSCHTGARIIANGLLVVEIKEDAGIDNGIL
jgi:hypothetical protein